MADKKQSNKERLQEITAGIEQGIKELFESEKYMNYLRTMSRFHNYSTNNIMLIHMQMPHASLVAGFNKWKDQFGRHVKKGERSIKIIAPTPFKKKIEEIKRDPDTKAPVLDKDGKAILEEKEIQIPMFKVVSVFDVSQTEGKPLPQLASDLKGNVQNYEIFMEALRRSSPVPMTMAPIRDNADGFFSADTQSITIRSGMSEVQTVSAAVHEITHAKLHNYEKERLAAAKGDETKEPPKPKDRRTEEVEAESVSYSVCQYYGIETGDNSFGYIASWSKGKELPELKASLDTINKTASSLIRDIDMHFAEICKERGIDLSVQPEHMAQDVSEPKKTTEETISAPVPENQTQDEKAEEIPPAADPEPSEQKEIQTPQSPVPEKIVTAGEPSQPEPLRYYVAECMEFPDLGEHHENLSLADAIRLYHAIPAERMNGIKGIGFELPEDGSLYGGTSFPILEGNTIDVDIINMIDDFRDNPLVQKAVDDLIAAMPEIEVLRQEPVKQPEPEIPQAEPVETSYRYYITQDALDNGTYPQMEGVHIQEEPRITEYENGTVRAYGFIEYPQPLTRGQIAESGLLPSESVSMPEEKLCVLDDSVYLHIQSSENGWDYTLYDVETLKELDGGQLDAPDIMLSTAVLRISEMHGLGSDSIKLAPLAMIDTLQEAALNATQEAVQERQEHFDHENPVVGNTALDQYPMPDSGLTVEELEKDYGYLDGDMLPLSKDRAAELLERDFTIYAIVDGGSAEMVFDREDLDERPLDAVFTIPREEWEQSKEFDHQVQDRLNHQEEREAAFLEHGGDCFAIFQIKDDDPQRLRFMNLDWLQSKGLTPDHANYDLIYTGNLSGDNSGPKEPTVAELEQQARSGQPISLLALAEASHREEREKKKSVVKKLKSQPKQEHKKTAPKKSAEREI
mgnify:CR=1 FL=1|jgi:antirestriction protein ArdC|uniref:LPD16 domain-containing protein n=1 Tax=Enterocloster clostridioformis TaxID=1531 RepID=UPI0026761C24|nr:LPD16 domain-containing protein [Enterocloster clostridioformis]